ncbi:MAG: hypothetical protein ABEJ40_05750 [Haloarculaceae archaeon]
MSLLDDVDEGKLSTNSALLKRVVPGYDYRTHEARAATDRAIREKLERDLDDAKRALDDASDRLYEAGEDAVAALERSFAGRQDYLQGLR